MKSPKEREDILVVEPHVYSNEALAIYKKIGTVRLVSDEKKIKAFPKKGDEKTTILVTRFHMRIDKALMERLPRLKIIGMPTTGLNHIDVAYAEEKGIKIVSLKGHADFLKNVPSTAEHTFALLLSLIRNIPSSFDAVKKGEWNHVPYIGRQLEGKTIGLIGFGRLGKIVARFAKAFGMKVIAHDPYITVTEMKKSFVESVSLSDVLKTSDIVSLHVAFSPETKALIGFSDFKKMKRSALFINTARAEIIEKGALAKALAGKVIAGAAIDVMDNESGKGGFLKKDSLWKYAKKHDNLIISPHLGGATKEAMGMTEVYIAKRVAALVHSNEKNK